MALGLAYLTGGLVGQALAVRRGASSTRWWWSVVIFMVATVAGARLWYVAGDAAYYLENPFDVWRPPIEGLSFAGGLAAAAVCLVVVRRYLGLRLASLLDVLALSYLAGSVVAGVVWRSPVSLQAASNGMAIALDAIYVTGLYALLWWLWTRERSSGRPGAAALTTLAGDGVLRLGLSSIALLSGPGGGAFWLHAARVATMVTVVGVFILHRFVSRAPEGMRPFHRPLSRWLGWFVVYAVLIAVLAAVRT